MNKRFENMPISKIVVEWNNYVFETNQSENVFWTLEELMQTLKYQLNTDIDYITRSLIRSENIDFSADWFTISPDFIIKSYYNSNVLDAGFVDLNDLHDWLIYTGQVQEIDTEVDEEDKEEKEDHQLIVRMIKCPDGHILRSQYVHDFDSHEDENGNSYFIDGGTDYLRVGGNYKDLEDISVYTDSPIEVIANNWKIRGKLSKDYNAYELQQMMETSNEFIKKMISRLLAEYYYMP